MHCRSMQARFCCICSGDPDIQDRTKISPKLDNSEARSRHHRDCKHQGSFPSSVHSAPLKDSLQMARKTMQRGQGFTMG